MKNTCFVSVIVPTRGLRPSLTYCIMSLLNQSYHSYEIIVVDNSPLHTLKKTWSHTKIRCIHEKREGAAYARNTGIRRAKGIIIAFLDDDCAAHKDWIKHIVKAFAQHGSHVALKGNNINALPQNIIASTEYYCDELFFRSAYSTRKRITYSAWIDTKNCAISRNILQTHRLRFRPFLVFEDLEFSYQLRKRNIPIVYCPQIQVKHAGRASLFSHIIRSLRIGYDYAYLKQLLLSYPQTSNFSRVEIDILRGSKRSTYQIQRLIHSLTDSQNIWYRTKMYILIHATIHSIQLAYHLCRTYLRLALYLHAIHGPGQDSGDVP